jgi:mono/diheme cytochrome c family protein
MRKGRLGALAGALVAVPALASAQGADLGRIEYMSNCAQCHGIEAKGDGIIAEYLTVAPPDLTTIQRDNDGVFPFRWLYEVIEGGRVSGPHGTREMPAWGDRYAADAPQALGLPYSPLERDAYIHGRILALIDYIATLQEP